MRVEHQVGPRSSLNGLLDFRLKAKPIKLWRAF